MNTKELNAYADGAIDAYSEGIFLDTYVNNPELRQAYKMGYDYGIALFCQHNEEVEHG